MIKLKRLFAFLCSLRATLPEAPCGYRWSRAGEIPTHWTDERGRVSRVFGRFAVTRTYPNPHGKCGYLQRTEDDE